MRVMATDTATYIFAAPCGFGPHYSNSGTSLVLHSSPSAQLQSSLYYRASAHYLSAPPPITCPWRVFIGTLL